LISFLQNAFRARSLSAKTKEKIMKKMIAMVAGAAMLAGATMGVANAQSKATGPFADVPTDHWAYQSVEKLRSAGIVIGYPDGTYGGNKSMSRYEFATAIARLLKLIPDGDTIVTREQLSGVALKSDLPSFSDYASKSDLSTLQSSVEQRFAGNDQAIAALRELVNEFAPELKALGVRVDAANARIDSLDKRVTTLEAEVARVKITGTLSTIVRSEVNTSPSAAQPVDQDGNLIGENNTTTHGRTSIFDKPAVYQDFLLNIVGKASDTTNAVVSIDAGNYTSWLGLGKGYTASPTGEPTTSRGVSTNFNIYKAYLSAPVSFGLYNGTGEFGRFGVQFTPFTLQQVSADSYAYSQQNNSGDVIIDGVKTTGTSGGFGLSAFAGVASNDYATTLGKISGKGSALNGYYRPGANGLGSQNFNQEPIDNVGGLRLTLPNVAGFKIGLTDVLSRTQTSLNDPKNNAPYNTVNVFGADLAGSIIGLGVAGEYDQSTTGINSNIGKVNGGYYTQAWNAGVSDTLGSLDLKANYEAIYPYYNASGNWQAIGSWLNPTNIKGFKVDGAYQLSNKISLKGSGAGYQGIANVAADSPLGKDDKLVDATATLGFDLGKSTALDLGYEWVRWDLKGHQNELGLKAGKPVEQYLTIGIGHSIGRNAAIKALYQVLTYKDEGTGFNNGNGDTHGGVFVTQATVSF
jgi:hypothetical protein